MSIHANRNIKPAQQGQSLSSTLKFLAGIGREAIESLYASTARAVFERKEAFEDAQAERKASHRAVARKGVAASSVARKSAKINHRA